MEFIATLLPETGMKVLVNVNLPDEAVPLIMRGRVAGIKPHRTSLGESRVWIRFTHVPKTLGATLAEIGEAMT